MSRMTRQQAIEALAAGVDADLEGSARILELLEHQFDAALRHQSARLAELAEGLGPLLDEMDGRRRQRVSLVRALAGAEGTMAGLIGTLAEPLQTRLAGAWRDLEQQVMACKGATARNSHLLAEQFSVMQRVMHGEEQIYAPR